MRLIPLLLFAVLLMGCLQRSIHSAMGTRDQGVEVTLPSSAAEAAALLLQSSKPSADVDKALAVISEYEDESVRLEKTIKAADGSLHIGLQQRFPKLGIVVHHYDQKFTHACRIPMNTATSNQ